MKSNAEEMDGEYQSVRCQRGRLGSTRTAVEASQSATQPPSLLDGIAGAKAKARQGRAGLGKARQGKARAANGKQGNKLWGTMYQYSPRSRKSGSRVSTFFHLAATSHQPGRQSHLTALHASTRLHATCSETLRKNVDFMPTTHRQCHSRGAVSTVSVGVGVDVSV
jgi:uncharacterized low-complexity protein